MKLSNVLLAPSHIVALQKITQAITGLCTALIVAHFLSTEEQGYFYTMGSLLSSYIFFDLGLSTYLLQRSAQLSCSLRNDRFWNIKPEGEQRCEFLAFTYWTIKWYRNTGVIASVVIALIGFGVLSTNSNTAVGFSWHWPWVLIVTAIGINMPTIGLLSILEGTGAIRETYLLRTAHYLIGAFLAWSLIANGYGLYAQAFPLYATAFVCYGWFIFKEKLKLKRVPSSTTKKITRSILPHIKFTASFCLWNYLFLNTATILVFLSGDIISSGQIGLSIVIANAGGAVAMASATAKMPFIMRHSQSGNCHLAKKILADSLMKFLGLYSLGSAILIACCYFGAEYNLFLRMLKPTDLSLLLITFAAFHITNTVIVYLRVIPCNWLTIAINVLSLAIITLSYLFKSMGITGTILSLLLCSVTGCLVVLSRLAYQRTKINY